MVELVTLFLGFVAGPRLVELSVDGPVARVEIRLDGQTVARLDAPPWSAEVDFGDALLPHRLEALAWDANGTLVDRSDRLINVARGNYEASIELTPANRRRDRAGRVRWGAVLGQAPSRIDLRLDGRSVAVDRHGRFVLPEHDRARAHALTVEVFFPDGASAGAELTFGGAYGERVTSALTAVPIFAPPGQPWTREEVTGWFEQGGVALEVFAARAAPGRLVVVRDETLLRRRQRLPSHADVPDGLASARAVAVSTRPLAAHAGTFELTELGPAERLVEEGLWRRTERELFGGERRAKQQSLWDAVAVAGRDAAASGRPRAVLLLARSPSTRAADRSRFDAGQARRYLESLRVPLFVWTPEDGSAALTARFAALARSLSSQTVAWLHGEHLPAEIELSAAAPPGVALVP